MRLLMTTDTVGGVWTFTCELASELLARGHDVALVSFGRAPSSEQRAWVGTLTVRLINFVFLSCEAPLEWMPENASAYGGGESLLLHLCESFQPDALLLSQFCFGALPLTLPKIVVAHDAWLRTYCSLVQRGLDGADAVVAPTRAMLHDLRAHFAVSADTAVIANGRTLSASGDVFSRKLQAVTAGRMWDQAKNLRVLAECVSPMSIFVAGENTGAECSNSDVVILGQFSEAGLLQLFRRSGIYICSSVYEPFGLAPLEAALCGCAVLANDIPSLREVWGDSALYFNDAASLTRLLSVMCSCPDELAAAQARSHACALTYTSARMAEHYMHLIEQITTTAARSEAHAA
jgi:glycogen(starch) synthase